MLEILLATVSALVWGGKPCSICGDLVLRPDIIPPTSDFFYEFAGYTCGKLDQLAQSSITEDSEIVMLEKIHTHVFAVNNV